MKTPKKVRRAKILISLPDDLKLRLKKYSRLKGETASHYVREALAQYLDSHEARL